jgi:hypothetical protein
MVGTIAEIDRLEAATWWGQPRGKRWRSSPACQAKARLRSRKRAVRLLRRETRAYRRWWKRDRRR